MLQHLLVLAETAKDAASEHAPESAHAAEEATSGGIGALGIDLKSLILQVVTFLVLFLILKKFAFKPILATLEERRKTIDESLKTAEAIKHREASSREEADAILAEAREQADKIIAEGQAEAGAIVKDAEEKAAKKSQNILAEAQSKIERDVTEARKELKSELLGLVSQATETVAEVKLDASKDAKLIKKALGEELS